jgi:hypothetical protein
MKASLLLAASLGLAPAISLAQATPHVYIGAAAFLSNSGPFRSYSENDLGPALTVGYQLSPRWAIQSGVSWAWHNSSFFSDYRNSNSPYERVTYDLHTDKFVIPLLARYTFTDPASPLHVDALLGASWLYTTGRTAITYSQATSSYTDTFKGNSTSFSASIGPSVRYTLGAHVDLVATSIMQVALTNRYGSFTDRLSLNTQVGVQYSLGQ